jgi:NAD/NADP transhydrogenase beta subunit
MEKKKKKSKMQYSKQMCTRSWVLMAVTVCGCIGGEFALQWTDKGTMHQVVTVVLSLISFVTVFINGGYITQNIFRDTSLNKHGLTISDTGETKYILKLEKTEGV